MVIMNLKADNIYSFKAFQINFSYPKKIVNTTIPNEYLKERPNFRYKKVNIIMGANATGKTTLGLLLSALYDLIEHGVSLDIRPTDINKPIAITLDFVLDDLTLYRLDIKSSNEIEQLVCIRQALINLQDSYEECVKKIEKQDLVYSEAITKELNKVNKRARPKAQNKELYIKVLQNVLQTLDPTINKVEGLDGIDDAYILWWHDKKIILQEGKLTLEHLLSSGTKAGIEIAKCITDIMCHNDCLYYFDERFSFIESDIEKAIISLMIEKLQSDEQLFITTLNSDILDMNLPKHAFSFLKRNDENGIEVINASSMLKKNTDYVRKAYNNNMFSTAPNLKFIDTLV